MVPLSSSIVSQFLIAGLVVGTVPYAVSQGASPDEAVAMTVLPAPSSADLAAEHRYLELAEASTIEASPTATVEEAAIALAGSLAAIPVGAMEDAATCPTEKLAVSWVEPGPEHVHGAFVTPLGPPPGPDTEEVNGVVLCDGYPYAFMGFEATREGSTWDVVAVPFLGSDSEEHGHEPANEDADDHAHDDHDHDAGPAEPAQPAPRIDVPVADLGPIEGYAPFEPQRLCHPTAKPGTDALRRLLTGHYTSTRNLGIVRGCSVGGRSEHKEGRAFDWGAYAHREVERKSVEDLIGRLLATDEAGNRHALARRMGVMYIIWNERIWSAYRHDAGWRPYGGRSPHTDHAHISLSWDGAMGRTSFWTANGVEALFGTPSGSSLAAAQPVHGAPAPPTGAHDDDHDDHTRVSDEATEIARAERDDAREEYDKRIREWREARERRQREREERRAAGLPVDEESEAEVAAREAEEAAEEAKEALKEAQKDTERAERRAQHAAALAAQRAERDADREQRQQDREQRQQDREAQKTERRSEREAEREQRRAEKEAERAERRAQEASEREQRRQEREDQRRQQRDEQRAAAEQEREERRAQKERERAERQAQKEVERAERRAQKERERAERQAQKEVERAERRAQKEREREEHRAQKEAARAERQAEKERRRGGGDG